MWSDFKEQILQRNKTLWQVAGPQRDLHSGNDGGVFNEPLADLTKVLASLIDSRNNIQVRVEGYQYCTTLA
jgi:hypothetical protein